MFFICHKWGRKIISYTTDMLQNLLYPTSYVYDLTDTKTETNEEISLKIMNLKSKAS